MYVGRLDTTSPEINLASQGYCAKVIIKPKAESGFLPALPPTLKPLGFVGVFHTSSFPLALFNNNNKNNNKNKDDAVKLAKSSKVHSAVHLQSLFVTKPAWSTDVCVCSREMFSTARRIQNRLIMSPWCHAGMAASALRCMMYS